ncbi:MAG TPA: sorbitol dehydrogenase [Thermoanaerobaculia bacterium]|nr:sorbitol dehydrogenase [Thermoanaerobaculia bacterium]
MSETSSSPQRMEDFVQMSALLTGFAAGTIAPSLDPVDLKSTLFAAAEKGAGDAFDRLLDQYAQLAGGKPVSQMTPAERQSIGESLLGLDGQPSDPQTTATARSVMRLLYLGYWYPIDGSAGAETVVSDQAYVRGLAWRAMQSHAMGFSTWSYGYWASPPPPLTDFTGNPAPAPPADAAAEVPAGTAAASLPAEAAAASTLGQGKGGQSPADLVGGR